MPVLKFSESFALNMMQLTLESAPEEDIGLIYYLLALLMIALDQATKWLVVKNMELGEAIPVIGDFFQIYSHRNRGAAFGILEGQRWFFIVITIIVVIGIIWYLNRMMRENNRILCTGLGFLLGGALGNFIDRASTGEVVDFFKFRFQFSWFGQDVDYTFAIFNVADAAINIGVGFIILEALLAWRRERKERLINESAE